MSSSQYISGCMAYLPRDVNSSSNETQCTAAISSGKIAGFSALALFLLMLCALFAGLTLAICSVDMTWLYVLGASGSEQQRHQSLVVSRIRRRTGWFLCSMIICSVACTESMPIIIRELGIGNGVWEPILISTLGVALLAELIPQYFIPRRALLWGYHCWPVIWGCMWLTCFISWPLSVILDRIAGPLTDRGVYTTEQLAVLIKYHERSEKHGGLVGFDAGRIARAALHLEARTLRSQTTSFLVPFKTCSEDDVEQGAGKTSGIIVPWSHVRSIDINDEVTEELIMKIRGWAYSRIPVVGDGDEKSCDLDSAKLCRNGQKLYGFLHIKNLLEFSFLGRESGRLLVKDLPLYPLPIVRDDLPVYDLLSLFQMGMSRIAVVIETPRKDRIVPLGASEVNTDVLPRHQVPLWSAHSGLNNRHTVTMQAFEKHVDWTTDFLNAAQRDAEIPLHRKDSVIGIGCPEPLGIVTYEDILETLLQKTTYDEMDFFDRNAPVQKTPKEGDASSVMSTQSVVRTKRDAPSYMQRIHGAFERPGQDPGFIRRRNVSMPFGGHDGADDICDVSLVRTNSGIGTHTTRELDTSSYTNNSRGGFHGQDQSFCSNDDAMVISPAKFALMTNRVPTDSYGVNYRPMRTSSSPAELAAVHSPRKNVEPESTLRNMGCFEVKLRKVRRVAPFADFKVAHDKSVSLRASPKLQNVGFHPSITVIEQQKHRSLSFESKNNNKIGSSIKIRPTQTRKAVVRCASRTSQADLVESDDNQHISHRPNSLQSISMHSGKETLVPVGFNSLNLPENKTPQYVFSKSCDSRVHERVEVFHDDRALLPSQCGSQNV